MSSFKLNCKIELITEDDEITFGLIQDIIGDKIYVSISSDDREFKILRIGEKLQGLAYDKEKVISFDAILTDRIQGDIPTYELSSLSNFSNIQRRQDVRVLCSIKLTYTGNKYMLNIDDAKEELETILQVISKYASHGIISDLSAGGLRFSCDENFEMKGRLLLIFELQAQTIIVKGKIVYKSLSSGPKKTRYTYGIKFNDISEAKREKIINHIFVLMRKNRLK